MEKSKEEIKADELIDMFKKSISAVLYGEIDEAAVLCAINCVDEIIKSVPLEPHEGYYEILSDRTGETLKFWQKVKQILIDKQK